MELHHTVWVCMSQRCVDTLVVVTSHKQVSALCAKQPHKLLIAGVQVLELINYEILDAWQLRRRQSSEPQGFHPFINYLSGENATVEVGPSAMERIELLLLSLSNLSLCHSGRIECVPPSVMGFPYLPRTSRRGPEKVGQFRIVHVLLFPIVEHDGVARGLSQLIAAVKYAKRQRMHRRNAHLCCGCSKTSWCL